jgi:hypothetical protein
VGGKRGKRGFKGTCDALFAPSKRIHVRGDLRGEIFLDTLIHELTHAANPTLDEDFVNRFATDAARVIMTPEIWDRVTGQ